MADATTSPLENQAPPVTAASSTSQSQQAEESMASALVLYDNKSINEKDIALQKADNQNDELCREVRAVIWEQCLPCGLVAPWYYGGSHQFAPRPNTLHVIAQVCREAQQVALKHGSGENAIAHRSYRFPNGPTELFTPVRCWYNYKTDVIYINKHMHSYVSKDQQVHHGSGENEMMRLAVQDTSTDLLIRFYKLRHLILAWTGGEFLYERLLKPRTHCFFQLWLIKICITEATQQEALRMGLIDHPNEEYPPAVINASDKAGLHKYANLMDLCYYREEYTCCGDARDGIGELIAQGGVKPGSAMQAGIVQFEKALIKSHCACAELNLDHIDVDHAVDDDGQLVKDDPLVVQLNLSMPSWTPHGDSETSDDEGPADDGEKSDTEQPAGEEAGDSDI
ncbi:hypothetical protein VP1G_00316 [Cytospora mali]|uniref:Uncharacterized protein n=1 Tax=Cytospora mali TaxID=578113 RepID=A0A194UN51_CYTMA|nr:hypothetical protein VP1G_00316 [Valsa mali var. pyri (nom. inval.)]